MKFLILLLILAIIPVVAAIPEIPHQFYGSISNSSGSINSGTLTAKLDTKEFATPIINGKYGLSNPFLVHREDSSATNIEFYFEGHKVYNFTYQAGVYTQLNLDIPVFGILDNSTFDDDENRHHKNDNEDIIVVSPPIPQDTKSNLPITQPANNQSSSSGFFASLKDITGKIISAPFKTTTNSIISSFVLALLVISGSLYAITGMNFMLSPLKTIRRAKLKIGYWRYLKGI